MGLALSKDKRYTYAYFPFTGYADLYDRQADPDELHNLAGDPAHVGRGLGMAVCTAVLQRFHRAGYHRVFLRTDDFRLPALKIYLKLGFLPLLYQEDMETRWETICQALKWPFTPTLWPQS